MALPARTRRSRRALPHRGWLARVPSADAGPPFRRHHRLPGSRHAVSGARRGSAQPHPRDLSTLMQKPDLHPVFDLWVASDGDEVTGAALRTPPFNWSSPSPRTIPLSMRSSTGCSSRGPRPARGRGRDPRSRRSSARGRQARRGCGDRLPARDARLREVMDVPSAPGGARPVTPEDREQVIAWALAFADEVLEETDRERHVRLIDARLRATATRGSGSGKTAEARSPSPDTADRHRTASGSDRLYTTGAPGSRICDQPGDSRATGCSVPAVRSASSTRTSTTRRRTRSTVASVIGWWRRHARSGSTSGCRVRRQHSGGGAGAPSFGTTTNATSPA